MSGKGAGTAKGESGRAGLKIVEISIAETDTSGRLRPAHPAVVEQLAGDIEARGLRQPIEVARKGKGWQLVSGLHRFMACKSLGWSTIPSVEVTGNLPALQRDQLLENLARNELSALERCQFTAVLKGLFLSENPGAARGVAGGKARQGQQMPSLALAEWYGEIAARSERAIRTIKRQAAIGERLDEEAADRLRGSEFEDNQFELEALSKRHAEQQRQVAAMLTDPDSPAGSVANALAALAGQPAEAADRAGRTIAKALDRFRRWGRSERREFVSGLSDAEFDELVELRRAVIKAGQI